MSRSRRVWIILGPVLALVAGLGGWFCFPALRLLAHTGQLNAIPKPQAEWVDAHRYDSEWFDAARVGRVDILQALYEAHYPVDSQTSSGYSAVILAAYDEQPEALRYLLSVGANACLGDHNGNTALMGALYKGHMGIVRMLLDTPCPIDQTNKVGETASAFAVLFGRLDVLPQLAGKGAKLDHADAHGETPLQIAVKQGNGEAVAALQKLGIVR